jgi:hypothetical protein
MSRRDFLFTVPAAATTLLALQGCLGDSGDQGGRYEVPTDARTDTDAARSALAGEEFVFDVQGHHLEYDLMRGYSGEPYFGEVFPRSTAARTTPGPASPVRSSSRSSS